MERLRRQLRFSNRLYVEPQGSSGGLALWWDETVNLSIFSFDRFFFDGCCSVAGSDTSWHFTFVYGEPNIQLRRPMWTRVMEMRRHTSTPWLLMGDLNLVGDSTDKRGKRPPTMLDRTILHELISVCSLREIGFKGLVFTWTNRRHGEENVRERLDRALMNDSWHRMFPKAQLFHCTRMGSDHSPLLLSLQAIPETRRKRFRYELKWQMQTGYSDAILQGWSTDKTGSPLFYLMSKLHNLKKTLQTWSRNVPKRPQEEIDKLQKELDALQHNQSSISTIEQEENLIKKINTLWAQEEAHWFQRARANWINFGDKNSRYFHAVATRRRQNNHIFQLKDDTGRILDKEDTILNYVYSHFKQAYSSQHSPNYNLIADLI
ncbi:hypothetical protein SLA2020_341660 [Shorea laevis]